MASIPVSVPAFDLHDKSRWTARFRRIANYQLVNSVSLVFAALMACGWYRESLALDRNSQALDNLRKHPPVIMEGQLGLAELVVYQDANTEPEDLEIRSALSFWTMYHFDHARATVGDFRAKSFAWMLKSYGDAIQAQDTREHYVKNILTGTDKQYRIVVTNAVITRTDHKKDDTESGAADIFAQRQYIGEDGLAQPIENKDSFVVHVTWQLAAEVQNDLVKFNPRGIAVTSYSSYQSMQ